MIMRFMTNLSAIASFSVMQSIIKNLALHSLLQRFHQLSSGDVIWMMYVKSAAGLKEVY